MEDDFSFEEELKLPEEPFHIEADVYDTGDYSRLLVVPCNDKYMVILNDDHLCTLVQSCDQPDCWELEDGDVDEELVERLGTAIKGYAI